MPAVPTSPLRSSREQNCWRASVLFFRKTAVSLCAICAALLLATGCSSIRNNYTKDAAYALAPPPAGDSSLVHGIDRQIALHHAGDSGFRLLALSSEALAARLALADQAVRSIDVQYYMIHNDSTGRLVLRHIVAAAERGVRVRILIDDNHIAGDDRDVLALNAHPNIEVRLFNPFKGRQGGLANVIQYLFDSRRLNRRMHNKSFIVDSRAAIIGGRNIGDEYFDARQDMNFRDLDVIAIGPIVSDICASFDTFWNSSAAYPLNAFYRLSKHRRTLDRYSAALQQDARSLPPGATSDAFTTGDFALDDTAGETPEAGAPVPAPQRDAAHLRWCWGSAKLIADTPDKANPDYNNLSKKGPRIGDTVAGIIATTRKSFLLVSPYFIPRKPGVALLAGLVARGASVKVLTNSLASTDIPIVQAGYARYRPALLKAGVELYELRYLPSQKRKRFFIGRRSASISLHAKTFVIDGATTFIGSMNIDPRSELLNTEMGVLVDCPELARDVTGFFREATAPDSSYQLHLAPGAWGRQKLYWTGSPDGKPVTYKHDPNASLPFRLRIDFMRLFPIEGLL